MSTKNQKVQILESWEKQRYPVPLELVRLVRTCRVCGSNRWWEDGSIPSFWVARCTSCEPPPPRATILTTSERSSDPEMINLVGKGVNAWNERMSHPPFVRPRLAKVDLALKNLEGINLSRADLFMARLPGAVLKGAKFVLANLEQAEMRFAVLPSADCQQAGFVKTDLSGANLERADLRRAILTKANLASANLKRADLRGAKLNGANLSKADLRGAHLDDAVLSGADLSEAKLTMACLCRADLRNANLSGTKLWKANLVEAKLEKAILVGTSLRRADMSNAAVYGASAWDMDLYLTNQSGLLVTPTESSGQMKVDHMEVAQFIYLLLDNKKIRDVLNTFGNKGVLILGRFTERKEILEAIRQEVRKEGYLPIIFDFPRPVDRDFKETILTVAGLSRFIIADLTWPQSVPLEAQVTIPNYRIPFVPIIDAREETFSMFGDLWREHKEWVLKPLKYESPEQLIAVFKVGVIGPANERLAVLRRLKAEEMATRSAKDILKELDTL